jgi:hypothetical protein
VLDLDGWQGPETLGLQHASHHAHGVGWGVFMLLS